MNFRMMGCLTLLVGLSLATTALAGQPSPTGRITGVVLDPGGVPQMGAAVVVTEQSLGASPTLRLLTNENGRFVTPDLRAGLYSVRVTLAGFLPSLEEDVPVGGSRTTALHIALGSVFSGLATLHDAKDEPRPSREWGWVLRASESTRPILRLQNGGLILVSHKGSSAEPGAHPRQPRSQIDFTSGVRPGSATSFADSPATSFAFDQAVGETGQLLFAGQFSYESQSPSGGFAAVWLPRGESKSGSSTEVALRQSRLGPAGPMFRAMRLDRDGVFPISDRVTLRYGADYLLASLGGATTMGVRPRAEVALQLSPSWQASFLVASRPWPETSPEATAPLQSVLNSLDAFPTMLFRNGRPVLENGWHEEVAIQHLVGKHATVTMAGFHDRSTNTAIFGQGGNTSNPDFLQDFFYNGFAYDAGTSSSWGTRVAYQQKVSNSLSTTVVYAWAGALTPVMEKAPNVSLRDALATEYHHSVAASISSRLPRLGTEVTTGYKWINGQAVSRQDEFGEAYYHLDPYLNLVVRQPIPCRFFHNMDAIADFGNLLAQGYIPMTTRDGRVVMVAAYRTFRGGISLQF